MLDNLEKMTQGQKDQFKDTANKLLSQTYLSKDKRDNKEAYYFLMSYKDIFDEFFTILGYEIELDQPNGSAMLKGAPTSMMLKLKRDESIILIILRLLYHEKMKETTLNENIVIDISDIHNKYDLLEIKKKHFWSLTFTEIIGSLLIQAKNDANEQNIIAQVQSKFDPFVNQFTVQVEKDNMEEIGTSMNDSSSPDTVFSL